VPDLRARRPGVRLQQRRRRDDLSGRAEAALQGVGLDERVDERVLAQPLDGGDLSLPDRVQERDAREDGDAVELDGARAAVTLVARDLRSRQADLLTERLRKRTADRRVEPEALSVDDELKQAPSPPGCPRCGSCGTPLA
jgi:hypothetical protein